MNRAALQALGEGAYVITATRRLSYELKSAYDKHQLKQGKKVWPTAMVLTWDGWMQMLWHDISAYSSYNVLSNAQLQQLMGDIIELDLNTHELHAENGLTALWNISATARTALDAWQLCHQWRISYTALQAAEQVDHARFGHWAARLYARLQEQNWISPVQLADRLMETEFNTSHDAILFGFDHLNTQQHRFIEFYRGQGGSAVQINSKNAIASQLSHYSFDSSEAEWRQIGAWARNKLLNSSELSIGIITPNTEGIRTLAENSLREQLTPSYFERSGSDPFHFSIGEKLADQPAINSALTCLGLLGELEFKQLSAGFLSSYWGSDTEQLLRARLCIDLRRKIAYRFDLYELIGAVTAAQSKPGSYIEQAQEQLEALLDKLRTLQSVKANNPGALPLSSWRELFKSCLLTLDWPVSKLDSNEFQAVQSWQNSLDEWVKLDAVCKPMSLIRALQSLNAFCRETVFQAQDRTQAPVQIMGVLEAAELDFDYVWLAGFDEQAWPVLSSTNPFIPVKTQIEAGIPNAILSLQTELTKSKTTQLCALSDHIIYSHARIQGDIELAVSPFFPAPSKPEPAALTDVFSLNEAIRLATPALESRSDDLGNCYREESTRGGSGLIQKQSACPFSAYARYRLNADEDEEPQIGMDSLERGSLLHKILETIWQELEDSNALRRCIERDELSELIQRHTQKHLKRFCAHSGLGKGFRRAERQRVNALITEWLELEAQRSPFSVAETELKFEYQINGLRLNLTLDRVDELAPSGTGNAAGSRLLIDYKSGNCSLKDWEGPRPGQPQLPVYFLALEENPSFGHVDALSFAQVKPGQCQFIGISQHEDMLPEVNSLDTLAGNTSLKKDVAEWPLLRPLWKARIEKLVSEYQQGFAHVDPKSPQSCHFCNFSPLCRIHTQNARDRDSDTD